MKRSFAWFTALGLAVALQIGCKKDEPAQTPPAQPAAGVEQPAAPTPAATGEAGGAAQEAPAQESPKAAQPSDQPAQGTAGGQAAGGTAEVQPQPTPSDSPAAVVPEGPAAAQGELPIDESKLDKLIEYSEAMTTILEQNATDPAAAAKKLEEYLASNKAEREQLLTEFEGLKEKLTPEQQTALGMKLLTKLGPLMQRMQKLFMEHPELASDPRIQEAMTPFKK